jgi:trigger factor
MGLNNANKIETNKYELEVSVDKDSFQKAVERVYRRNIGRMNVPGFRRGKAPRAYVEKIYGEGVFYEDAVNSLYPSAYEDAVKEAGIEPVDKADVEIVNIGKDGFTFKAKVTTKPEVELGEYKGLNAVKKIKKASDADVDAEVERVRERNARVITVDDRPAKDGDMVVIDFDGSVDGVPFSGGKGEKQNLTLGSGQFIPGFEEQVVGHSTGDEFDINVKFPDDYNAKEVAGKDAVFKIKLHEIKFRELPELDDEFAKDVSEFDTLDEYKSDVRKHIQDRYDDSAAEEVENSLMEQVIGAMTAEIPEIMYDNAVDGFVNDFGYRLQSQGINLETYLKYTGSNIGDFRKGFREQAEKQVKMRLALEKIAELESIEPSEEDIEGEYKKLAERYGMEIDKVKAAVSGEDLAKDIKSTKALEIVKNSAVISEEEAKDEPEEDKAEEKTEKKSAAKKTTRKAKSDDASEEAEAPKKAARKTTKKKDDKEEKAE